MNFQRKEQIGLNSNEIQEYLRVLKPLDVQQTTHPLISADLVYRQWLRGESMQSYLSWIPRLKSQIGWSWQDLRLLKYVIFCRAFSRADLDAAIQSRDPTLQVYEKWLKVELYRRFAKHSTPIRDRTWALENYETNPRAVMRWTMTLNMTRLPLYDLTEGELNYLWTMAKTNSIALAKQCPKMLYSWMQRPNIYKEIKCGTLKERARSMILFAVERNFNCFSVCVEPLLDLSKAGQSQELDESQFTQKRVEKAEKRFTVFFEKERRLHLAIIDQMIARLQRNPLDVGALGLLRSQQLFEDRQEKITVLLENPFAYNRAYQLLCQWKSEHWIGEAPRLPILIQLRAKPLIELKGLLEEFPQEVSLMVSYYYGEKYRFFMQWLAPLLCKWTQDCDLDGLVMHLGTYAVLWACCPPECFEELLQKVPAFEAWATLFYRLLEKKSRH